MSRKFSTNQFLNLTCGRLTACQHTAKRKIRQAAAPRSRDTSVNIHLANQGIARLTFVLPARARLRTDRWRASTFEEYSG